MKLLENMFYISFLLFVVTAGIGNYANNESEKELLELKIEETKLRILILRG